MDRQELQIHVGVNVEGVEVWSLGGGEEEDDGDVVAAG